MQNLIYGIGLTGQTFFTGRILIQWIASERASESIVPASFWVCSIMGSALLLIYAILRKDPVFVLGQSFGMVAYVRNLQLMKKARVCA